MSEKPRIPVAIPWAWGEGYCSDIFIEFRQPKKIDRLILLNAMVLPKKPMVMTSAPTDLENVKALVRISSKVESYIGHESTARLLSSILGVEVPVNRGEYVPQVGDTAIVVRLKRRLERPEDVQSVKLEDIEFYIVSYEDDRVREEPPVFVIYTLPG
jgi:sporulation protein YlmC with PRC-barrel domain